MDSPKQFDSQFPFSDTAASAVIVRQRINDLLRSVDRMIWKLAHSVGRQYHLSAEDIEDSVSECLMWLWKHSLPRYDAFKLPFVRPTTFVYTCSRNYFIKEMPRIQQRQDKKSTRIADIDLESRHARDVMHDAATFELAQDVMKNPEKYLPPVQAEVIRELMRNPSTKLKDISEALGYEAPNSLSMMLRRIKANVTDLPLEGHGEQRRTAKTSNS